MLVGSKEKKIKGQHLIIWGTLLSASVWNSKWSELNIVGFLKWWSLTSPSIRQRTWLNCCAWGTKTARTSTTCKSSWLGKWARSQISWDWWCRYWSVVNCPEAKNISSKSVSAWWSNPMCSCDTASPSYIAFHSVCEHFPQYTYVIQWTHVELYAHIISGLNILFLAQTPLFYLFSLNTL